MNNVRVSCSGKIGGFGLRLFIRSPSSKGTFQIVKRAKVAGSALDILMFPTHIKAKISSALAYPINAKLVSELLADVPQAQDFSISFVYWRSTATMHQSSEPYPVMSVSYSYRKPSLDNPQFLGEMLQQQVWQIIVQPVPSTLKHHVKEMLRNEAFPKVIAWLLTKQNLEGKPETHDFYVWYDENKDELRFREHYHP